MWRLIEQEQRGRQVPFQELAEAAGVSPATVARYRRGATRRVQRAVLRRLCAHFGWGDPAFVLREGMTWREWFARYVASTPRHDIRVTGGEDRWPMTASAVDRAPLTR